MPNLPLHIFLAQQAAEKLDWGFAYDCVGSFYLGSTAPDIRAMTKWPRVWLNINYIDKVHQLFPLL